MTDGDGLKPDMHPDFPHLRLSTAPVFDYFAIISDILQEAMGRRVDSLQQCSNALSRSATPSSRTDSSGTWSHRMYFFIDLN